MVSLYHIKILSAINIIKNKKCMIFSVLELIIFFQNNFISNQFIVIKTNLHQSKAGIGSKLKTQRFIDIIAVIISKNEKPFIRELLIK